MTNSLRTVTKLAVPGSSKELDYVINIYHNGEFKFAYRYKDWTLEAVEREISILETRFSSCNGYTISK